MTGQELDRQVRGELGTLSRDNATQVARHLVMTFQLLDDDPSTALRHAMAAQRRAGRVGLVREAAGLAAYRAGEYDQALRELRTARRLTGSQEHLAVMADCERGLGRPERALALAASPEARTLDRFSQLELLIVAAGARQDLGQHDAAVVMLQVPELKAPPGPATARLLSAYADALEAAGRSAEAPQWLHRAAVADVDGGTGAAERLGLESEDEMITDLLDGLDEVEDEVDAAATGAGAVQGPESSVSPPTAGADGPTQDSGSDGVPSAAEPQSREGVAGEPVDVDDHDPDAGLEGQQTIPGALFSDPPTSDAPTSDASDDPNQE